MVDGNLERQNQVKEDQATRDAFMDALRQKAADQPGVAPAFTNQPGAGRDRYYVPPANGVERRPTYGPSGTLFPGHEQYNQQQQKPVPNFRDAHADKARDPNKPYERADFGIPGARPNGSQPADRTSYAWNGGDFFSARENGVIDRRGQYTNLGMAYGFAAFAGVMTPALHSGITRLADRSVAKNPESSWARAWQENFDPTKSGSSDLIKQGSKYKSAYEQFEDLRQGLKTAANGTGPEAEAAKEKLQFIEQRTAAGKLAATNVTEAQVMRHGTEGAKLFSDAEVKVLADRATADAATESRLAKMGSRINALRENTPPWVERAVSGVVGTALTYGAVSVDRGLTNKEGGTDALHKSWNASQFLAPIALAAMPGWKSKALGLVGAVAGSQIIDNVTRPIGGSPDRWNAATGPFDGWNGGATAASLALATYAKNPWAKAAIAGIGTVVPVAMHAYEDNIGGNIKGRTDNVRSSLADDHSERTLNSLERANNKMADLMGHRDIVTRTFGGILGIGKDASTRGESDWIVNNADQSNAALNKYWGKMTPEQKLLSLRDDAAAAGAIGETTLEKGTRISDRTTTARYEIGGYDLDVGGRALHYLIRSRNSADKAAQLTQAIINNNNDGSSPTIKIQGDVPKSQEVTDLQKYAGRIDEKVDKLLNGKHDIRAAFDDMVAQSKVIDKTFLKTFLGQTDGVIREYYGRMQKAQQEAQSATDDTARQAALQKADEDAKVMAKVYRDRALVYMALAHNKTKDGGGVYDYLIDDGKNHDPGQNVNGAQGNLRQAEALAPGNADMDELGKLFAEEASSMVKKQEAQVNNPSTNVLGWHDVYSRR